MRHFPSLTLIVIILAVKCEAAEDGDGVVQGPAVPSYNESLRLVTEAMEDVNNVTRTINLVSEDMARSVERQNEVSDYLQTHEGLTGDVHCAGGVGVGVLADGQLPVSRGPQHDRGGHPLETLQVSHQPPYQSGELNPTSRLFIQTTDGRNP